MSKGRTIIQKGDFNWDEWDTEPTYKVNEHDKILSEEPYAQQLYNVMSAHWLNNDLITPKIGNTVKGHVVRRFDDHAEVDINWRESAYIDLTKEIEDYIKYIQPGCEIDVIIKTISTKNTSNSFPITVSYSEVVRQEKVKDIRESIGNNVAYLAKVNSLVYGGYFLSIDGIEVFMPGSQGGMNKLVDFESLLGKDLYVCPINYDKGKDFVVVSHRAYLKAQVPTYAESLEQGQEKTGFVTGTTKFGVFVEFDECLTGLIHKTDLEKLTDFETGLIKPGDKISFKIKEVIDPFRIVLTQKEVIYTKDPWEDIESRYKTPSQVKGKIKEIARFGLFIELEPKLTGLLHKSEYSDIDIDFKKGDDITVDLYRIDKEAKKLFFKL